MPDRYRIHGRRIPSHGLRLERPQVRIGRYSARISPPRILAANLIVKGSHSPNIRGYKYRAQFLIRGVPFSADLQPYPGSSNGGMLSFPPASLYRASFRYNVDGSMPSASDARVLLPPSCCSTQVM